jgi:hypothetical protein
MDTPHDAELALGEIEAAIGRLLIQRALVRRQRNAFLPVSRLPSELLAHILLLASVHPLKTSNVPQSVFVPPQVPDYHSVTCFSHVSAGFRHVALGSGALWSAPPFHLISDADVMKDILRRSLNTPLTIVLRVPHWECIARSFDSVAHRECITTRLQSTRVLSLQWAFWNESIDWIERLGNPTSSLEVLDAVWPQDRVEGPLPLPLQAPKLSSLSIFVGTLSLDLPSNIPRMASLRSLALTTPALRPADVTRITQLLNQAPSLEELSIYDIEDYGRVIGWEHVDATSDLRLPRPTWSLIPLLRRVRWIANPVNIFCGCKILQSYQPPPRVGVEIVQDSISDPNGVSVAALKTYLLMLGQGPQRAIIALPPSQTADQRYEMRLSGFGENSTRTVLFDIRYHEVLERLTTCVTWRALQNVDIRLSGPVPKVLWRELAKHGSPELRSIRVSFVTPTACGLVHAFMEDIDTDPRGVFVPALRSLSVANAAFTLKDLEDLGDALEARRQLGLVLEELVFERCTWANGLVEGEEEKLENMLLPAKLRECVHDLRIVD